MSALRVLVGSAAWGVGADRDHSDGTLLLDLGPDHPSRAGLVELRVVLDDSGERIESTDVRVGAMHRGVEKLFEVRDYRQALMLADRHDWQAPFAGELTMALACEDLLAMAVPQGATWLRMLVAEHTRIASHLGFLGYLTRDDVELAAQGRGLREDLRQTLAGLTGNRVHPMLTRIGGVAAAPGHDWLAAEVATVERADTHARRVLDMLAQQYGNQRAIAPIPRTIVGQYGLSGPLARATGMDLDLRRHRPYLAYDRLKVPGPRTDAGDAWSRLAQLAWEIGDSARMVATAAERLAGIEGPWAQPLPKVIKLPDAQGYVATEAPLGVAGAHVVSRGDQTPWRVHLRTPSFAHVSALPAVLPGVRVADLEFALASIGYVVGDIDR